MSFESAISSIISPVVDTVSNVVETAVDTVANVASKIQDEVTQALSGDAGEEKANVDSFEKTADAQQAEAAEIDSKLDENAKAQDENDNALSQTTSAISATDAEIESAEATLSALQQAEQAASSEEGGAQSSQEISSQIQAVEANIQDLNAKKADLEEQKEELENNAETLEQEETAIEEEGAKAEADAQDSASEGQESANEAEATATEAKEYEVEAEAKENEQTTEVDEEAPAAEPVVEETPVAEAPVEEAPVAEAPVQEAPVAEKPAAPVAEPVVERQTINTTYDALERIKNNEETDAKMAEVIVNDMFDSSAMIAQDAIVGMDARDAVAVVAESYKAETFSKNVYSTNISSNTDTATIDENREAVADFMDTFSEVLDKVNSPKVEFLSLTDKSNFEAVSSVADRLNNSEYVITREIEKATSTADSIQVAATETEDTEEKTSKLKGADLLAQLEKAITEDKNAKENKNDDILTQKEYDDEENFFNNTDNFTLAYKQLVQDAKQYNVFAA